jgi:hypothetical protein
MNDTIKPQPEWKGCLRKIVTLMGITIVIMVPVALIYVAYESTQYTSSRAICANNLSQMYKAMYVYISRFGGNKNYMPHVGDAFFTCLLGHKGSEHPDSYEKKAPCFGNEDLFCCDKSGSDTSSVTPGDRMADYMGPKQDPAATGGPSALIDGLFPGRAIACDDPQNHKGAGGNVLRYDGSVGFMTDDDYLKAQEYCTH